MTHSIREGHRVVSAIDWFTWASALKFLGSLHVICSLPSVFFTVAKLIILSDVVEPRILVTVEFFPFFIIFGSTKIFLIDSGLSSYSERATTRSTIKATTGSICMAFTSRSLNQPSGTKHQEKKLSSVSVFGLSSLAMFLGLVFSDCCLRHIARASLTASSPSLPFSPRFWHWALHAEPAWHHLTQMLVDWHLQMGAIQGRLYQLLGRSS